MKRKSISAVGSVVGISLLLWCGCGSKQNSTTQSQVSGSSSPGTGTITIDANISQGSRFILYSNDTWAAPQRDSIVPGTWHAYQFVVSTPLQSLRLDPSEASSATVLIRSITLSLPGQNPKSLPLSIMPKFLTNNASVTYDSTKNQVEIQSTGPNMYIMSTVDPSSYPAA